jgi:hypothetical protein
MRREGEVRVETTTFASGQGAQVEQRKIHQLRASNYDRECSLSATHAHSRRSGLVTFSGLGDHPFQPEQNVLAKTESHRQMPQAFKALLRNLAGFIEHLLEVIP